MQAGAVARSHYLGPAKLQLVDPIRTCFEFKLTLSTSRTQLMHPKSFAADRGSPMSDANAFAGGRRFPFDAAWAGSFREFVDEPAASIFESLRRFVHTSGALQDDAWGEQISSLKLELNKLVAADNRASAYSNILEYVVPLELRRADVVLLVANGVIVVEYKSKRSPSAADIDQVAAYARDLRSYHHECTGMAVHAVVVPTRTEATASYERHGVVVCPPTELDALVRKLTEGGRTGSLPLDRFFAAEAYRPIPSLVQAARALFHSGALPTVWRAAAATDPAVEYISRVAHDAARTRTRHLVLVTGTPGAGKTLVGMRAVHAHYLDDLAVQRKSGTPTTPGRFLSGNQPLVDVLKHVLKVEGSSGGTFVSHIKAYLNRYAPAPDRVPPEHLLVFDEAQRAFTPDKVKSIHPDWPADVVASEPELFVRLCERIPDWCVLIGLIGTGQSIYIGEEGGLQQWCDALLNSSRRDEWTVHAPAKVEEVFSGTALRTSWAPELHLNTQLRFHSAGSWHEAVDGLLSERTTSPDVVREPVARAYADGDNGFRIWVTRDLGTAKQYLRERYAGAPHARYGVLASSRDKLLGRFNIPNDFMQYSKLPVGPWFVDGLESEHSCCHLETCMTEFQAQGLELDMALIAWGSDLRRSSGSWISSDARRFASGDVRVRDPHTLRVNSYRVLLTRGRDGSVIYVPNDRCMDETWAFLRDVGFLELPQDDTGTPSG